MRASSCGARTGSGCRNNALITLKIAAFPPIASESVSTAAVENALFRTISPQTMREVLTEVGAESRQTTLPVDPIVQPADGGAGAAQVPNSDKACARAAARSSPRASRSLARISCEAQLVPHIAPHVAPPSATRT